MDGDIIIVSGVKWSFDAEGRGGIHVSSALQHDIFAGIRNGKQVGTRSPLKAPVLKPQLFYRK